MPTWTDEEKEQVREICAIPNSTGNYAELVARLALLTDAQATITRRDIAQWVLIEYGTTKAKGGLKGADYDQERERLQITNKVRSRLNYPKLADTLDPDAIVGFTMRTRGSFDYAESTSGEL